MSTSASRTLFIVNLLCCYCWQQVGVKHNLRCVPCADAINSLLTTSCARKHIHTLTYLPIYYSITKLCIIAKNIHIQIMWNVARIMCVFVFAESTSSYSILDQLFTCPPNEEYIQCDSVCEHVHRQCCARDTCFSYKWFSVIRAVYFASTVWLKQGVHAHIYTIESIEFNSNSVGREEFLSKWTVKSLGNQLSRN